MSSRRRVIAVVVALVVLAGAGTAFAVLRSPGRQPGKAAEQVRLGTAALAASDVKGARAHFTKAINYDDHNKDAHYDLGYVLQVYDHKAADAEVEYRKAIDLDPGFTKALYSLAIIRSNAMATDEAISLYQHVLQLDPNYAEAHFNLGLLLIDTGHDAAGHTEVNKGIALKPSLGAGLATTTTTINKKK